MLIGIGQNKTVAELARDYAYNDEFYVKSGDGDGPALRRRSPTPWRGRRRSPSAAM